jgi:hypothetical protein
MIIFLPLMYRIRILMEYIDDYHEDIKKYQAIIRESMIYDDKLKSNPYRDYYGNPTNEEMYYPMMESFSNPIEVSMKECEEKLEIQNKILKEVT